MKRMMVLISILVIGLMAAFAKTNSPTSAWVGVQLLGSQTFLCIDTGLACDGYGALTCNIMVETISGPITINAHPSVSCLSTQSNSSNFPIGYYVPISGLILSAQ